MKVSAVWIAKNEASEIVRSIESVKAVADEMVVVDTGSTDDTAALAEKAGARVETFAWNGDFAAARNFALSQVDGDAVFFLDADEWFEPALQKQDRNVLQKQFVDSQLIVMAVQRTDVDPDMGVVISVGESERILRGGALRYEGPIHEQLRPASKQWTGRATMPGWNLNHSGYRQSSSAAKRLRNRNMLQQALQTMPDDKMKALYHFYLMREMFLMQKQEAFQSLSWLLEHPSQTKEFLRHYPGVGKSFLFDGISLAAEQDNREHASRKQVHRVIVETGQKEYTGDPLSHIIGLYYDLHFDKVDARLLDELPKALEEAEALRGGETVDMGDYLRGMIDICVAAGQAAWRRGQREQAFDYASKALSQDVAIFREAAVKLLLRCVKGLPAEDVILFLEKVVGADRRGMREALIRYCEYEGFADVYTYLMKKELDEGLATKGDFWYLLVLLGRYQEAIDMALAARDTTDSQLVQQTLYLAILCSGQMELLPQYLDELGAYGPILELFFYGKSSENMNFGIVVATYQRIAFAAGRQTANRLLRAFRGLEWQCFLVQSSYYMDGGFYAELLEDTIYEPNDNDVVGLQRLAECEIFCAKHKEALLHLRTVLQHNPLNEDWFNLLAIIAEQASDESLKTEAKELYDNYHTEYEEWLDLQDVVNTGLVFEADSKKGRRALVDMAPQSFESSVKPSPVPAFTGQVAVLHEAADILLEKKCYEAALRCYQRVLSHLAATTETYRGLAELFGKLDNEAMARLMWQNAKENQT